MKFISFDVSDYLKKILVLGISYNHHTRRIYISFTDQRPTIIFDVWGEDIKKTVEGFRQEVKGTMNQKNQEEITKCLADNWYKIIDLMNTLQGGNGDADPDQSATAQTQSQTQSPIVPLSKAELVIAVAKDNIDNLFIDEYKDPHAAIKVGDHLEVLPLSSGRFRHWLSRIVYTDEGEVIDSNVFNNALGILKAQAIFDSGDPIKLNLRVAQVGQDQSCCWYYDLTNKNWEFVKITPDGWEVTKDLILFHRYNNQLAQVYPSRDYDPNILDRFIKLVLNDSNVKEKDKLGEYRMLLKCYVICAFIADIPKAILTPYGGQGAAKTSLMELVKILIDPSVILTLSFPREINEFIQQLSHNYIAFYDNVSILKDWISDQICRAVSGSGSSKRQLYTDDEDIIRNLMRCIGLNGINLAATKPDILDRSIFFELTRISDKQRRYVKAVKRQFEEMRPQLLGYIFDVLVKVLAWAERNGMIELDKLPRMADWAGYCEIIASCMGLPDGKFTEAYENNAKIQVEQVMETSEVAICLSHLVESDPKFKEKDLEGKPVWGFEGTANELKRELEDVAPVVGIEIKSKEWPKKANGLTRILNIIKHTLKEADIEIETGYHDSTGKKRIIKIRKLSSEPSDRQKNSAQAQKNRAQSGSADDTDDTDDTDDDLHTNKSDNDKIKIENPPKVKRPICGKIDYPYYLKRHKHMENE
jgi:hypothetical protein